MGKCAFCQSQQRSTKEHFEKKDPTSENNNIAILRCNPKLGCASQDVKLPKQTVGPANVRQSFVKKSGKRSPESASRTQIHKNFGKNHQHSGTSGTFLWKLSRVDRKSSQPQHAHFCRQRSKQQAVGRRWCQKSSLTMGQKVVKKIAERTL